MYRLHLVTVTGGLMLLLFASLVASLGLGPAVLSPREIFLTLAYHVGLLPDMALTRVRDAIVWELRLPRLLAAAATGAGLALCGAIMQAVTRNPLADPYLLGLSAGASVGAVVCLLFGLTIVMPAGAFVGAGAAIGLTLLIAQAMGGATPSRTILAGITVSALAAAASSFLVFWSATGDSYREILSWLMGSMSGVVWSEAVLTLGAVILIGMPVVFLGRALDAFAFGDDAAVSLGVDVTRIRWMFLGATALLTGLLVAIGGAIGFVGLVVPHIARLVIGTRHRVSLPVTMLLGAIFMVWTDTAARSLFSPRELPVGIITALLGAPIFLLVLIRYRRMT